MLHLHEIWQCFLLERSREIVMGSGGFLWVWIMEDEIFKHSITFFWVCFAGKMPANNTY
jgi:hypothetical protein